MSTKPALSATRALCLPTRRTSSSTGGTTSGAVPAWVISSTPGMNGAGLEKCTPKNRAGSVREPASSAMGSVEVLLPMMACGRALVSMAARTGPLTSGRSTTASSMRSAEATASARDAPAVRCSATAAALPGANSPRSSKSRASSRRRWWCRRVLSTSASKIVVGIPARARTCAIPPPMYPAPMTVAVSIALT